MRTYKISRIVHSCSGGSVGYVLERQQPFASLVEANAWAQANVKGAYTVEVIE